MEQFPVTYIRQRFEDKAVGVRMDCLSRYEVPLPVQPGSVNTYIGNRTVIDPGPDYPAARTALDEALDEQGLTPGDVEQVVVTHPHVDHFGQAYRFGREGASIVASRHAAPILEEYEPYFRERQEFFSGFLHRHGLSEETVRAVLSGAEAFLDQAVSVPVEVRVGNGQTLPLGDATATAHVTSGHAIGELLLLFDRDDGRVAVVGDHVLDGITPNPVLQHPYRLESTPRMVVRYVRSLRQLRARGFTRLLPGHGPLIGTPNERVEALLESIYARNEAARRAITGRTTALEVMRTLFDDIDTDECFAGMSEAIGHLEALRYWDRAVRVEENGRVYYQRAKDT